MAKPTDEGGLPLVTWLQAETLQALHEGRTAGSVMAERRDRRDTFYSHTRALRERGLITAGKQGEKGSIKALVRPRDYLIKGEKPLNEAWFTSLVVDLARQALTDESAVSVLADALQDAGCDDRDVLDILLKGPPRSISVDEALPVLPAPQSRRGANRPAWEASRQRQRDRARYIDPRVEFLRRRKRLLQRIVN
jgi:hypothetical protein